MARQIDKKLDVVGRLARDLKSGQYITNKGLVTELCDQYHEFKGHPNPIVAADFCVNCVSGYSIQQPGGGSKPKILYKIAYNRYVRYEPRLHGSWACRVINGKKTVIGTN
jgi:hypothetical protein